MAALTKLSPLQFNQFTHKFNSFAISNPANYSNKRPLLIHIKCSSDPIQDTDISSYKWCAGIGALGFLETSYLTYTKVSNSDAFCPIGAGSCSDILNSSYADVFGVPLPLIGMISYGLVSALGFKLAQNDLPFGISESNGKLVLLGTSTSMAAASSYFLYILSTQFTGSSCSYCLASVALSFGLLLSTYKALGFQEVIKEVGLQIFIVSLVVTTLNASYSTSLPASPILTGSNQEVFTTEITTPSTPFAISLANHLRSTGAKMYGAFWCSHCIEQKQIFGHEAAKLLDYVECFPNGGNDFSKMAKECKNIVTEGFPMWVIDGKVLNGQKSLSELAILSKFQADDSSQPS